MVNLIEMEAKRRDISLNPMVKKEKGFFDSISKQFKLIEERREKARVKQIDKTRKETARLRELVKLEKTKRKLATERQRLTKLRSRKVSNPFGLSTNLFGFQEPRRKKRR